MPLILGLLLFAMSMVLGSNTDTEQLAAALGVFGIVCIVTGIVGMVFIGV